jgi:simple sugar transport system permease protein
MRTLRAFLTDLLLVLGAIAATAAILTVALAMGGHSPHFLLDWAAGACGSWGQILVSMRDACPLILTGLAAGVAFRSGVFNIGAEGQSILGSIAAVTLATRLAPASTPALIAIPLTLLVAAFGGALWALLPAGLDRLRGVPIVLSTILLNFVALFLARLLIEGPLKTAKTGVSQSDALQGGFLLPILAQSGPGYVHVGILIAVGIAAIAWLVQSRTAFGFEILVTGLNPVAAQYAGMPVARRQFAVMLLSGAFAGLAGAVHLMGVEGSHSLGSDPVTYGYAGIAVALLGRLHPVGIVLAAIFFAMLDTGAVPLQFKTSLPQEISDIVKGLIVLVILAATAMVARRRSVAAEH